MRLITVLLLAAATACCDGPSDRSTANAALDEVITVIEAGDTQALQQRLEFAREPCTTALGAGGPPKCVPGESLGTTIGVFQYVSCEPEWIRPDGVPRLLDAVFTHPFRLYAAYETGAGYEAVFTATDAPAVGGGIAATVIDGKISALRRTCGAGDTAASLLPQPPPEFLVSPPD